jgi:glycosyltransferase involved in cell wall biosynthesis
MTERPLVTIAISTYNRAGSYLLQAVDSALAQTYANLEVIVSDNCSADNTPSLMRTRASERLRYFRHCQNIGANSNFNFCLEKARGKYFLLLHDDDHIDPDFVETCITAADGAEEIGLIRTGTRVVDSKNRIRSSKLNRCSGMSPADLFLAWFRRSTAFYLCSTLFNTARLREAGGFWSPANLYQDVAAIARLAVPHRRVDVTEIKASFRRHDQNKGSGESALAWAEDSRYLLGLLGELMPERSEEFLEAGLPYLSRKCYRVARAIPSVRKRWRTYFIINERFDRACSPIRYALEQFRKETRATARDLFRENRETVGATGGS